ncbi:TPA: DUF5594 family protein, partial [Burkholderia cenocepacia]|nr:DUF5594 family protein [Burkholderia cenocepacia]
AVDRPTRVAIHGKPSGPGYPHPLNAYLTWSDSAIEELLAEVNPARIDRYVAALPQKMEQWGQEAKIDFGTRTQAQIAILISRLDFDA